MQKLEGLAKSKKGAIELSIGTIVIVVLAMSMLILGLILIKGIFSTSTSAVNQIDQQLKNQLAKMFGEDKRLVVYPDTRRVEVRQGEIEGFVFAIRNLQQGTTGNSLFSYEIVVADSAVRTKCGVNELEILALLDSPKEESNIPLASGGITEIPIFFKTQIGDPQCNVRFRVNVKVNNEAYDSELMDVTFKA